MRRMICCGKMSEKPKLNFNDLIEFAPYNDVLTNIIILSDVGVNFSGFA